MVHFQDLSSTRIRQLSTENTPGTAPGTPLRHCMVTDFKLTKLLCMPGGRGSGEGG